MPAGTLDPPPAIGKPLARVEGKLKVTGAATYSAEFARPRLAYAALIQSTIANGRVSKLDLSAAQTAPGVVGILTRENTPRFNPYPDDLTKRARRAKAVSHWRAIRFIGSDNILASLSLNLS